MPGEVQRGIASVFKAAVWSLYTGLGQHWVFPTGSSVSLFLCWEIFCSCFENGSKNTTRKQAVNYSPGNNRKAQVQSQTPGEMDACPCSLVLTTPCFLQCAGPPREQHVGD